MKIDWSNTPEDDGDETGYFESGDRSLVYQETLAWLGSLCDILLRESDRNDADLAVSMPVGVAVKASRFLVTQMGPRSRAWADSVAREPDKGKDFFAWWNPEKDAAYYLNRALYLMWTDVRWRVPLIESERQTLKEVAKSLDSAHALDATLPYPWREWNQVLEYLGDEARIPRIEQSRPFQSLIGYRRKPVRVALAAGWSIRIPGSFAQAWEDNTWCGWDPDITVWITAFRSEMDGLQESASKIFSEFRPDSDDIVTYQAEGTAGRGSITWVEENMSQRLAALEIWRSLTR